MLRLVPLSLIILFLSGLLLVQTQHQPTTAQMVPPLRQHADTLGFVLGTAVHDHAITDDATYRQVVAREFNALSPENELKFKFLSPSQGSYNFGAADRIVDFAEANNMLVRGLPLIWHKGDPQWLRNGNLPPDTLRQIFTDHITRIVTRYGNRIPVWGVVNEAFMIDGSLRNNIWRQNLGDGYIEEAFRLAHAANPNALLFIDDFGNEHLNSKSDGMYNFLADLVARGVPVHGIGFQMHLRLDQPLDIASIDANIRRFGELGLQVHITELDVRVHEGTGSDADRQAQQAEVYQAVTDVCLRNSNCTALITWGFTDRYTWIPGYTGNPDTPLLFDAQYNPKPAYTAVNNTLTTYAEGIPTLPEGPALVVNTETAVSDPNTLQVHFDLHEVSDVYGLEVHCQADPSALIGQSYRGGAGFADDNSLFVDTGFSAGDGQWSLAVSRMRPAPALNGDLRAFSLDYSILSPGAGMVDCRVMAVDPNGYALPLTIVNGSTHSSANRDEYAVVQPQLPDGAALGVESTITGVVNRQRGSDHSDMTVQLMQDGVIVAEISTDSSGRYVFSDVPAGRYRLLLGAPAHLSQFHDIDLQNQPVDLGLSQLLAGDIDGSTVIDVLDATLIGANFLLAVPPGPENADLTGDGLIDVRDLVLVGLNLGHSGPQ